MFQGFRCSHSRASVTFCSLIFENVVRAVPLPRAFRAPNFGRLGICTVGGGSIGKGLAAADEAVVPPSTMDAAFEEKLKDGAEAFEFQAEVLYRRHARHCKKSCRIVPARCFVLGLLHAVYG